MIVFLSALFDGADLSLLLYSMAGESLPTQKLND